MRPVTSNALLVLIGDILARLLGYVALFHVTAVLGPSRFGAVTLGLAVLSHALLLVDLGLYTLGIREAAKPPGARLVPLGRFVRLELLLALAVFVVGQGILFVLPLDLLLERVLRLYLLYTFSYALLIDWYHQGIRNYSAVTVSKFVNGVVYAGGVYLLVRSESDVLLVPIIYLAAGLSSVIWLGIRARRVDFTAASSTRDGGFSSMLKGSIPIGAGALLGQGIQALPPIALAFYYTTVETGVFGIVLKIATALMMVDRIFVALFLPFVSRMWVDHRERLNEILAAALSLVVAASFSLSCAITLCSRSILDLVGTEYTSGAPALAVLAWYPAVTILNSYFAYSLIAVGREKSYLRVSLISAIFSALCILLFAWLWGVVGAAVAVVVGETFMTAVMYLEFRASFKVRVARPLLPSLGVAVAIVGLGTYLGLGMLWQAPLILCAFLLAVFLLRGITRRELSMIFGR